MANKPYYDIYANMLIEDRSNGGQGATDYPQLTNKPAINGVTITGNKTGSEFGLANIEDLGHGLSLGFDGVLENNVITFTPPSTSGVYDIKHDYEYEIDLHFLAVELNDDSIEMEIQNGDEKIQIICPTHKDSSTKVTFGDLKQMMAYNQEIGYRWLFRARCKVTSAGVKILLVYPVIVNMADIPESVMLPITNQEMLDAESDETPMYRGRVIKTGDIFTCIDDDGYCAGRNYRWTGVVGAEWEDRTIDTSVMEKLNKIDTKISGDGVKGILVVDELPTTQLQDVLYFVMEA